VGPAAAVTLPLFDQGQADVATSRAYALQAQSQGVATAARIRGQARSVAVRFRAAEAAVMRLEHGLLPMREKLLESTQREFNAMLLGVFQLLQAKRDQLQAHKLHIHAQREYWLTRTQIEQLVAGGLPGVAAAEPAGFSPGTSSSSAAAAH
jgi:outer membrane protein, heavy metal efflux system